MKINDILRGSNEIIEENKNHLDALREAEIMVKTSRFAFIKLARMRNVLQFYFNNYISKE
ncbi:hypothetical protein PBI_SCTP2_212 [Salicola phage SCTP-2]|nr:hypothetical protein PBI_SCTP2_212 [Salicola phage SCTP-2]